MVDKCILQWIHLIVGKIRRGGFICQAWIGDHAPRHVHVFRDGKLVLKYDLDNDVVLQGRAERRVLSLIDELKREGAL